MKYQVVVQNQGNTYWLGGTVWRFNPGGAKLHNSREEAQAALDKAKPFMAVAIYRKAIIEEVQG